MRIQKILRLELADGTGLYSSGIPMLVSLQDAMRHPPPQDDDLLWFKLGCRYVTYNEGQILDAIYEASEANISKWWFAYADKRMCQSWLYKTEWLHELHDSGIVISEYYCNFDNIIFGNTQVIFDQYLNRFSYKIPDYFNLPPSRQR
jgi:hypothetical protein